MDHQEACRLLTVIMHAVWLPAFLALLIAIVFCAAVLTFKGPKQ